MQIIKKILQGIMAALFVIIGLLLSAFFSKPSKDRKETDRERRIHKEREAFKRGYDEFDDE